MPLFFDKSTFLTRKQAQQSYRFVLRINDVDSALIKSVNVPKYTIDTTSYSMLEYEFKYPKKVKWDGKVSFDIIQMLDDNIFTSVVGHFMSKLYNPKYYASPLGIGDAERDPLLPNALYTAKDRIDNFFNLGINAGYERSSDEGSVIELSKQKLSAILKVVEIQTLDQNGEKFDSWRLNGAYITGVSPTDLTYDSETVSTVKVDLSYDWADYGFRGVYAEEDSVQRLFGI